MNVYAERRNKLLSAMSDNSCLILFSGNALMKSEDESYPFSVNRNFYYLTGLDAEGMILCLQKFNGLESTKLFILPYDEYLAKWVGGRMKADEAYEISDIEDVYDIEDFVEHFASFYNRTRAFGGTKVYLDLWHYNYEQSPSKATSFAKEVKEKYPSLKIEDAFSLITNLRLCKDEEEIASKKDSQEICFIKDDDYQRFLKENMQKQPKKGKIVLTTGEVLGTHNGLINYTIGQRKGLGISYKEPLYVVRLDIKNNQVVVGTETELYNNQLEAMDVNWIVDIENRLEEGLECFAKIRYRAKEAKAKVIKEHEKIKVIFQEPQRAITQGQSVVFYDADGIVLGGGKIK